MKEFIDKLLKVYKTPRVVQLMQNDDYSFFF